MTRLLRSLAKTTTRRPGVSIVVLLVALIAAIGGGISAGGKTVDDFTVPGLEYQKADDLIAERFPGQDGDSATIVLTATSGTLRSADRAATIAAARSTIGGQPHVSSVEDPLSSGHVARDGRTAFATVSYDAKASDLEKAPRERLEKATAPLAKAGVDIALSGLIIDAGSEGEPPIGELAGLLVALILLFVVLRSARAALSAMLTAFLGVGLGFAMLGLAANGVDIPSLAPTVAALLGLGAGIDYALLSASRQQEELRAGRRPSDAAIRTNETAGHSAVTAAFIVLASISGLLVTGIPFLGKVGVAAGVMVLLTALVAVLLLPPLLTPRRGPVLGSSQCCAVVDDSACELQPPRAVLQGLDRGAQQLQAIGAAGREAEQPLRDAARSGRTEALSRVQHRGRPLPRLIRRPPRECDGDLARSELQGQRRALGRSKRQLVEGALDVAARERDPDSCRRHDA